MRISNTFTRFTRAAGLFAAVATLALALVGPAFAQNTKPAGGDAEAVGDAYPLGYCPVSGEELGSMGDPVEYDHEGRNIKFCCAGCEPTFKEEPARYLGQVDEELIKQQLPIYPLDTCIVSGMELGSMGDPIDQIHNNRLVRFCCAGCVPQFEKDPAKFMEKLDEAVIEAQAADYPLETCPVSGQELGSMGDPVNYVNANRLVKFCCAGCIGQFEAHPAKVHKDLDVAYVKAQMDEYPLETCVVSGMDLGSMGDPIEYLHGNTLVRLCCKGCVSKLEADPEKYLQKLDADSAEGEESHSGHEGHNH